MNSVYDWVGSLADYPMYFQLCVFPNTEVKPTDSVQKYSGTSLHMIELDEPLRLEDEGEVTWLGFSQKEESVITSSIGNTEQDHVEHYENELLAFDSLKVCKEEALSTLKGTVHCSVSRETIYQDIISIYRKRTNANQRVELTFNGEDAVGDGVTRDGYSAFFKCVYDKFEGCNERVPLTAMDTDELEIIGKVIHSAFICYDLFPVELCKASFIYALFKEVSDEELFLSFMNFLPPHEGRLVEEFAAGRIPQNQPIIDILCDHHVFDVPSSENVKSLFIKAANFSLIRATSFSINALVKGMGSFWQSITKEMFESIYACSIATPERIISSLVPNEVSHVDQKVTTWLHRYIRSCTKSELSTFIRFITGSSCFPPGEVIKVEFVNQSPDWLRPTVATCFKILRLPRQYQSFTQMCDNMKTYIDREDTWPVYDGDLL